MALVRCNGISEPRAINMKAQTVLSAEFAEIARYLRRCYEAVFTRIGDRERPRLDLMDVLPNSVDDPFSPNRVGHGTLTFHVD
jgi:hypothetical protein